MYKLNFFFILKPPDKKQEYELENLESRQTLF